MFGVFVVLWCLWIFGFGKGPFWWFLLFFALGGRCYDAFLLLCSCFALGEWGWMECVFSLLFFDVVFFWGVEILVLLVGYCDVF